jgi:hypothetical protein
MSVSAVSATGVAASQALQARPESREVHNAGRDTSKDGDGDDGGVSQVAAVKPSVNLNGQVLGSIVNTKA